MSTSSSFLSLEERVGALHELPLFLPWDFITSYVIPRVALTLCVLTVLFIVSVFVISSKIKKKKKNSNDEQQQRRVSLKTSYQLVNGCVNLTLGVLGLYHVLTRNTYPAYADTVEERIVFPEKDVNIGWLACLQLGYQLWALPVGCIFVDETTAMLCHHVAVIFVACLSAFLTNGFVFHNAYFFGLFELSSVPLAVINYYKDNGLDKQQRHLAVYQTTRIVFAALFLLIRIYMMIPRKYDFLLLSWHLAKTAPSMLLSVYLYGCWCASAFLAMLQVFWATLILRGIYNLVRPKKEKKTKQV